MTTYYCKCGRQVKKSSNADNTGNRDTAGCEGCPYLLPWGPMVWEKGQKDFVQDVKGQECRMSPTINYATTYHGQANDKCTCLLYTSSGPDGRLLPSRRTACGSELLGRLQ